MTLALLQASGALPGELARLGRLHPLLLHAPIGLLLGALLLELLATRGRLPRPALGLYLACAALAAVLAATTGWILGHEAGYEGSTVERHEQLGIAVAGLAVLAAALHGATAGAAARAGRRLALYRVALVLVCALLVPTGHFGSILTHGADWLDGPRVRRPASEAEAARDGERPPAPSAEVAPAPDETYATVIAPLLEARCASCHGAKKQKAHLRLDSLAAMLAGGESGPALVPGDPAASLLFQRASLPLEHEDHMPPEGKPQPTPEERAALEAWIRAGAPAGSGAPPQVESEGDDGLGSGDGLESPSTGAVPAEQPDLSAGAVARASPPAEALAALEQAFVHAERLDPTREEWWLDVAAIAPTFGDAELEALVVPLAPWVAELSLARSRISDASLAALARFPHLRRLDLRATSVGSAGLAALAGHPALESLELAQTKLDDGALDALLALPALRRLGLWRAGLSPEALARLGTVAGLVLETGAEPPSEALESEGELVFTSDRALPGAELVPEALRPLNATCPVSGKPVNPKYALVHTFADGTRVVGFCCPNCPKEFWADPAAFEAKLR